MLDSEERLRKALVSRIASHKPFSIGQVYTDAGLHRTCGFNMFPELHKKIKEASFKSGYRVNTNRSDSEIFQAVQEALRHYVGKGEPFSIKQVYDRANICRSVAVKYPGMLETLRKFSIESGFKSKIS